MAKQKSLVKEVKTREKQSLQVILAEFGYNHQYQVILVDGKRVDDLNTMVDMNNKIIILPKIRGG